MQRGKIGAEIVLGLLDPGMFFVDKSDIDEGMIDSEVRVWFITAVVRRPEEQTYTSHYAVNLDTGYTVARDSEKSVLRYRPSEEQRMASVPFRT